MCGSKHTLGAPINYRTINALSKIAELKHTLMHKSTTFSGSRLFHRFLIPARSGCTRHHNALSNKICSDRTSEYTGGLMHSIFAESLNLSQVKDSDTQNHTTHYYIAEIYPVLIHWMEIVRYLIILLRYTLPYYSVELYPALIHCCGILYVNTLLGYTQS